MRTKARTLGRGLRVLGVSQSPRDYGFAILEGPATLVDWGVRGLGKQKRRESLAKLTALISWYKPDVIVVEACQDDCRRGANVRARIRDLVILAKSLGIRVLQVTRSTVRKCFEPHRARTKEEIAKVIARELPELFHRQPRKRKLWTSEDPRMHIFDATALALAFYWCESRKSEA